MTWNEFVKLTGGNEGDLSVRVINERAGKEISFYETGTVYISDAKSGYVMPYKKCSLGLMYRMWLEFKEEIDDR